MGNDDTTGREGGGRAKGEGERVFLEGKGKREGKKEGGNTMNGFSKRIGYDSNKCKC